MGSATICILLKRQKSAEENTREANKAITRLKKKGFKNIQYHNGTTFINVPVKGALIDVNKAVDTMHEISGLWFYVVHDYLQDFFDEMKKHEYPKAMILCVCLYESFGKNILIRRLPNVNKRSIEKLRGAYEVIVMLYNNGIIEESVYNDMISVNQTRNDIIHRYISSLTSDEIGKEVKENNPKIKRSLEALKRINDTVN